MTRDTIQDHVICEKGNNAHSDTKRKLLSALYTISPQFKVNLLYVLLLSIPTVNSQLPEFVVHPVSVNTTDGAIVNFTCTANNNPTTMFFVVNGSVVSEDEEKKGFMELTIINMNGGKRRRSLLVTASANNNNTKIMCHAITNVTTVGSNDAILLVQGPLISVVDLSYSFIDSFTVNISWSPPFTLPGTDITGYNISVFGNTTTITNYFTSDSYYVLPLNDITDSPCNEIVVTVSGYNGLDGVTESLTGIYLPSAIINCPVPVSISISSEQQLSAVFDISDLCVGQYPESATFFLFSNGKLINSTDNPSVFALSMNSFTIDDRLMVSLDTNYTIVVSPSNLAGKFDFNSTIIFNTLSIQFVNFADTTEGRVCVECVFAPFSTRTDSGCTIELASDYMVQYSETFSKSSGSVLASGCIFDVIPGLYSVRILNGRGNVVDVLLLPFYNSVINITSATTPTGSTTEHTFNESPSGIVTVDSENLEGIAIAGWVTAAVFLFILIPISSSTIVILISYRNGKSERNACSQSESQQNDVGSAEGASQNARIQLNSTLMMKDSQETEAGSAEDSNQPTTSTLNNVQNATSGVKLAEKEVGSAEGASQSANKSKTQLKSTRMMKDSQETEAGSAEDGYQPTISTITDAQNPTSGVKSAEQSQPAQPSSSSQSQKLEVNSEADNGAEIPQASTLQTFFTSAWNLIQNLRSSGSNDHHSSPESSDTEDNSSEKQLHNSQPDTSDPSQHSERNRYNLDAITTAVTNAVTNAAIYFKVGSVFSNPDTESNGNLPPPSGPVP